MVPVNERPDWTLLSTLSIRTSGGCVRGSVDESALLHAARTADIRPRVASRM
jgi:hypothetical protein